ncbi:hypothetical protein JB92DRAFT_3106654 [Gautieria morchelliformis]|nr:hypothetical protein JB92DRAFT_3106654 [Gautieria morchelliformis]
MLRSFKQIQNAGLMGDTQHQSLRSSGQIDTATRHAQLHERSIALTEAQGIPDQIKGPQEPYNGVTRMICVALMDAADTDPEKFMLVKAGVKLAHPEPYTRGLDLEEFKGFVAGILRWLKMNCLLGPTTMQMQVDYLGTRLTGEAQEWFVQNIKHFDSQVCEWTLEMAMQGLQKRFMHSLTYHHALNKFDMVVQGMKTVQEMLNELTKYSRAHEKAATSTSEQLNKELLATRPPDPQPDLATDTAFIKEMGINPSLEAGPFQPQDRPGPSTSANADAMQVDPRPMPAPYTDVQMGSSPTAEEKDLDTEIYSD